MRIQTIEKIQERISGREALDFVKKRLLDIQELPITGVVAGQAVASAVIEYIGMEDQINPIYNDIDVFRPISRCFVQSLVEKEGFLKKQTEKDLETAKEVEEVLIQSRYGHVYHKTLLKNRMVGTTRDREVNTIFIEMEDHDYNVSKGDSKVFEVIKNFDINATKIGFEVNESSSLYFTKHFVQFLYSKQLEITKWQTPTHTLIRLFKKQKEMGANVYVNSEESIKLSMLLANVSRQGKIVTEKINAMDLSNDQLLLRRISPYITENLASLPLAFGEKHKQYFDEYLSDNDMLYLDDVLDGKYQTIKTKDVTMGEKFLDELTSFNGAGLLKVNDMDKCLEKGILGFETTEDLLSFRKNDFASYEGLLLNLPDLYKSLKNSKKNVVNSVSKDYEKYRKLLDKDRIYNTEESVLNRIFSNHMDIKFLKNVADATLEDYVRSKKELRFIFKNGHYRMGVHFQAGVPFKNMVIMGDNIRQLEKETGSFIGYLETETIHGVDLLDIGSCRKKMVEYEKQMNSPLFEPRVSFETEDYNVVELVRGMDLKKEGKDMKHCVGGYFNAVKRGQSIIIKIVPRNKNGQRATLEINPLNSISKMVKQDYVMGQIRGEKNKGITLDKEMYEVLLNINERFLFMFFDKKDVFKFDYIDADLFDKFLEYKELNRYGKFVRWMKHAKIGKIAVKIGKYLSVKEEMKKRIDYIINCLPDCYENPYERKLAEIDTRKTIAYKEHLELVEAKKLKEEDEGLVDLIKETEPLVHNMDDCIYLEEDVT